MKQEIKEAGDNIEKDLEFPLIRLNEFVNYLKFSRNFFNLIFLDHSILLGIFCRVTVEDHSLLVT